MRKQRIECIQTKQIHKFIQPLLDKGWIVVQMVAENVAATDTTPSGTWASGKEAIAGDIVIVLELQQDRIGELLKSDPLI